MAALKRLGIVAERDFGCLWAARTISHVGDYAFRIAFITYIIGETNSPNVLAVSAAALVVPSLAFYLFGGALSDRTNSQRTIMVSADLVRFALALVLAVVVVASGSIVALVATAVLISVGEGFFRPASFAFMKVITPKERLFNANSAMSVSQQIGIIGGPLIGGVLVSTVGPTLAFAFDGITFLVSALLIARIRHRGTKGAAVMAEPVGARPRGVRGLFGDVAEGLTYIREQRWLLIFLLVGPGANAVFAGVLDVTVPLIMAPDGASGAGFLGGYTTFQAVGALSGALILTRLAFTRLGTPLFGILAMMGASLAMVGVLGRTPAAFAMAFLYGVGLHIFNTIYRTLLHEKVPDEKLGRVSSVSDLAFNGAMPAGQLIVGPLAAALTARSATLGVGMLAALICLSALLSGDVRSLRGSAKPKSDAGEQPSPPEAESASESENASTRRE